MAEGRFISRNIAFSEQLGQVSMEADYLFMRMLPHLDCDGRLAGSPTSIRARVCPLRKEMTDVEVSTAIAELDQARLIVWYEVDGFQYVEYPNFEKYQVGLRKNREAASKIPASTSLGAARIRITQTTPAIIAENSGPTPDINRSTPDNSKGSKEKLREVKLSKDSSVSGDTKRSNWVADLCTDYTNATEGHIPPGELGRALKPIITTHGLEETRSRWNAFIRHADVKFGAAYFAKHFGNYKPDAHIIDPQGDEGMIMRALGMTA